MKVSLRWLSEFIDLPTEDPEELRDAFAGLGHEVEGIERLDVGWTGVTIAEVLEVVPHPDADKIRVCQVTTGGDPIEVVCGAWNFEAGARVPFAEPGATLPGDVEIGVREIRGVRSHGMICSERELELGEEHAGILVLAPDAPVGAAFADHVELPDVVFDLTITPNRPDAMSMVGLARELGARFGVPYRAPEPSFETEPGRPSVGVVIEDPTGCSRFTLREMHGIALGPSPLWMRRRLRTAGVRPISNAVDVTNYVMLELGHPLHAFDADRVAGDTLVIRRATEGEHLVTLDDIDRTLVPDDLVICDAAGPTSLAGTMGGAASEVSESTVRVLLEAATWDPPTIMNMSRRHLLRSEASARFERGVDPHLPLLASARAAELLQEIAGGSILAEAVDEVAVEHPPLTLSIGSRDVERLLGPGFAAGHVADLLRALDFGVEGDDPLQVTVPTFRPDVTRPVDLIEEVARLHGFDRFGASLPTGAAGGWTDAQRRARDLRATLVGAGLHQAVNMSFVGADDLAAFAYPDDHEARAVVRIRNPLREEESLLRTSLLPGLLRVLRYNRSHGTQELGLFEMGKVFFSRPFPEDPRIPDQPDRLAFAVMGALGSEEMGVEGTAVDVYAASALWRLVADRLQLSEHELEASHAPGFHPGRCARVIVEGSPVGWVGELHPATAAAYELEGRVAIGELDVAPLTRPVPFRRLSPPSTFPPVEFDLAFVVDESTTAASLLEATTATAAHLVEHAAVFDEYTGVSMGEGRKSLAIRYVLRAPDRTLTNEEAGEIRRTMIEAAEARGAVLRGAG